LAKSIYKRISWLRRKSILQIRVLLLGEEASLNEYDSEKYFDKNENENGNENGRGIEGIEHQQQKKKKQRQKSTTSSNKTKQNDN
jgi:hypothetical protein